MTPFWVTPGPGSDSCVLTLHIQPGAKRSEIVGLHGDALKIRIASLPVDGRANETLLAFLATTLGIPKRQLDLIAGDSSRKKRVAVTGMTAKTVTDKLLVHT